MPVNPLDRSRLATVLFVDDDAQVLAAYVRLFRRSPHQVFTATDAAMALQRLEGAGIDVVVCDDHMPGASGLDLAADIRRRWPGVITLLLSGELEPARMARAMADGLIAGHLEKPCGIAALMAAIQAAMDRRRGSSGSA